MDRMTHQQAGQKEKQMMLLRIRNKQKGRCWIKGEGPLGYRGSPTVVQREAATGSNTHCLHKTEAVEGFADYTFGQCCRGLVQA